MISGNHPGDENRTVFHPGAGVVFKVRKMPCYEMREDSLSLAV